MVGTAWCENEGTCCATAPMMARLEKTPMAAQKTTATFPMCPVAEGWDLYPRKWAMGSGNRGRIEGGSSGLRYRSMSTCQRNGPEGAFAAILGGPMLE